MKRSRSLSRTFALVLAGAAFSGVTASRAADPDRKLIVFGYNTQLPPDIQKNMSLYEASPFAGMVIGVTVPKEIKLGNGRATNRFGWLCWGTELGDADIAEAVTTLRARSDSDKITELFLRFNTAPGGVDWFDDDAWRRLVANNWRLAGRLVREARLRGIVFDTEQYSQCGPAFDYGFASHGGEYSWPECVDKVFQRGREAAQALNSEAADLDILLAFAHGWVYEHSARDGFNSLQRASYALMPAFLDGFLSAKAPETRVFDGWEGAYRYKTREEFRDASVMIRRKAAELSLVPETYMAEMKTSFGIWICDGKGRWNPKRPYYSAEELEAAVRYAFEFSDRYVWIYQQAIHPWKEPFFFDEYWRALRAAVAPYTGLPDSRPLSARPAAAPAPVPAAPPSPRPALVAHWPLQRDTANAVKGGDALVPPKSVAAPTFSTPGKSAVTALGLTSGSGSLLLPVAQLPAALPNGCSLRGTACITDSTPGRLQPLFSGLLSRRGPAFEVAVRSNGGDLRFECTQFDPDTGATTGWQATGFDHGPYQIYAITVRFDGDRFDGLFVNRHRAVFGLWDVSAHRPDVPHRVAALDGLRIGAPADGRPDASRKPGGWVADVQLFDGKLAGEELLAPTQQPPAWEFALSPGAVLLDFAGLKRSDTIVPDRWDVPVPTAFTRTTDDGELPKADQLDGKPAMRFTPEAKGWLEALSSGRDSQLTERCSYSITFQLASLPTGDAAYGLFGRGDGTGGGTSFGIYIDAEGRVLVHIRTTTNFAKNIVSEPGKVMPGKTHMLSFALDKPDGTLTLTLDGGVIASGPAKHGSPLVQSLRWRDTPLRIGYVRVDEKWAPSHPEPKECYLDGWVTDFRIERL